MSPSAPRRRRKRPYWLVAGTLLLAGAIVFAWWWLLREKSPALLRLSWPDFNDPEQMWNCRVNSRRFLVIVRPGAEVSVSADAVSGTFYCPGVGSVSGIKTCFEGPPEGTCRHVRFVGVDAAENMVECRLAVLSVKSGDAGDILGKKKAGPYSNPKKARAKKVRSHPERYVPPRWWIPMTGLERWPISENFALGDLLGDRLGRKDAPKHIALDYRLVWKLEGIRKALRERGIASRGMRIISGFREPLYNRSKRIGGSRYSRHQYGDAADFIVDSDGDGKWDDLDGNGKVDFGDVKPVARLVEDLEVDGTVAPGGIGAYRGTNDGVIGSVHVDCRGFFARWGSTYRRGKRTAIEWWSDRYKAPDESEESEERNSDSP